MLFDSKPPNRLFQAGAGHTSWLTFLDLGVAVWRRQVERIAGCFVKNQKSGFC